MSPSATASASIELANELLTRTAVTTDFARQALDRMRRRAGALEALFWTVTGTTATCVIHVSEAESDGVPATVEIGNRTVLSDGLRRQGALLCRAGELSGVEGLVPKGLQSFVVQFAPSIARAAGLLILGWDSVHPPCDQPAAAHLGTAAAVLLRTLTPPREPRAALAASIIDSLAERLVVVDRDGTIVCVNDAWAAWPMAAPAFENARPGANYFQIGRRAAADGGGHECAGILDGIQAVARGDQHVYQATVAGAASGHDKTVLLTATPLRHPDGGAVITHANLEPATTSDRATNLAEAPFSGVIDAMPIPIWVHGDDGRVIHGNACWRKITNVAPSGAATWTDVFHPDDRARAAAAVQSRRSSDRKATLEARMKAIDGTYRWSLCTLLPFSGMDGRLAAHLGWGYDVGVQRHSEWALAEMSSKLVAAQEDERSRIGRELHDDLGQQAALLATNIDTLLRARRVSAPRLRAGLAEVGLRVQDLAKSIHDLSHQLHPPKLKLLGLVKTLASLCQDVSRESGLKVNFRADAIPDGIPERIALCLWRVTQEALQNALKHSGAHAINVVLTTAGGLTLEVADTGRGFDPLASPDTGIGLLSMRERVELNGGTFLIDTSSLAGTTISATLPIAQHDRQRQPAVSVSTAGRRRARRHGGKRRMPA